MSIEFITADQLGSMAVCLSTEIEKPAIYRYIQEQLANAHQTEAYGIVMTCKFFNGRIADTIVFGFPDPSTMQIKGIPP